MDKLIIREALVQLIVRYEAWLPLRNVTEAELELARDRIAQANRALENLG